MMLPFFPRTGSHGAGIPGTNSAGASTPIGAYILHAGLYSNGVSRQALALLQVYNSQPINLSRTSLRILPPTRHTRDLSAEPSIFLVGRVNPHVLIPQVAASRRWEMAVTPYLGPEGHRFLREGRRRALNS